MKMWRVAAAGVTVWWVGLTLVRGQELELPRPGAIVVGEITGQGFLVVDGQRKPLKLEDRVRVGATIVTARRSLITLQLSNGAAVQIGAETEIEIEEFGQAPVSGSAKWAELKSEPTLSRTRLKLVKGDVMIDVKPLKVTRGSSFMLVVPAGTARTAEGALRASTMMSDYGLGICTLEVQKGAAEFELPGATFQPVPSGRKLAFALELDKASGTVKVGEMPKERPAAAK